MGLFDTVRCEYPLPDPRHQELEFQTKSLESLLDYYTITRDCRLVRQARSWDTTPSAEIEWPFHGDMLLYDRDPDKEEGLIEYLVRFTHGRVEWIRPLGEVEATPR
jgi:hypothetical protein